MKKRIVSFLLAVVMVVGLMPHVFAATYTVNGITLPLSGYGDGVAHTNCWEFAQMVYGALWNGSSFTSYRGTSDDMLRSVGDGDARVVNAYNVQRFVSQAPLGAVIRLSPSSYLNSSDGNGHSQIIIQKDSNGFTTYESNVNGGKVRIKYWTWSDYAKSGSSGGWSTQYGSGATLYFKYIKWPGAPAYSDYVDVGTNFYAYIINTGHWMHLTNDSNNVSLRAETGAANQVWYFERQSDGSYKITSVLDGNCMEVCNFGTTDGTNVQTYPYSGNTAQQWYISGESGAYTFRAKCASTVLDVANNGSEEGTNIQMWTSNGSSAQLFQIWPLANYVPPAPSLTLSASNKGCVGNNYAVNESITVSWNPVVGASSYWLHVVYTEGDDTDIINQDIGNTTTYTFTPSQKGFYWLTVQACNAAGSSSAGYEFNVRGIAGGHWVSGSAMGEEAYTFNQGDVVYFNYKLFDKPTGDLLYTYYNGDFSVTLSIIDPDGTTVVTKDFTRDDNDYISYKCTKAGTYTAAVKFNSDTYTKNFVVNESSYTVTYDANGGSNAPSSQTKSHGTDLTLSSTIPTKNTYTVSFDANGGTLEGDSSKQVSDSFKEWNTKSDGSGLSYAAGDVYSTDESITLYAQWENAKLGSLDKAYRDGFYFLGWYDSVSVDSDGDPSGNKYVSSTEITGDITLYAMWRDANQIIFGDVNRDGFTEFSDLVTINSYINGSATLDYDLQEFLLRADLNRDGEITQDDLTIVNQIRFDHISQNDLMSEFAGAEVVLGQTQYEYGTNIDTSAISLKIWFNSGVYYTISDGLYISGYDPYQIGTQTITVNFYQFSATRVVTVSAPEYSVVFDANGGSNAPSSQTKSYDTDLTLSSAIPTRFGYNFIGWATSSSATAATYQPGDSYTNNADVTLYAVWETAGTITGAYAGFNRSAAINYADVGKYYQFVPNSSTSYRILGTNDVEDDVDSRVYLYDANGTLLASDDDSGEGRMFLLDYDFTAGETYYIYVRYFGSSATGTINFSVKKGYPISYDANGGINAPSSGYKYYSIDMVLSNTAPTREGYTFLGWATSSTATSASYQPGDTYSTNASQTFYAVWQENINTVTYDANGGSNAPTQQTKAYGDTLTISNTIPTRFGWNFAGWATSSTATSATYQPGDSYSADADITLYAVWYLNSVLPVDTESDFAAVVAYSGKGVYYEYTPDVTAMYRIYGADDKDTRVYLYDESGTQLGADDDSAGSYQFCLDHELVAGNTYYIYVRYYSSSETGELNFGIKRGYTITYDANGGAGVPAAATKFHGIAITLSSTIPTRTGYTFLGWSTSSAADAASYSAGAAFDVNADTVLYAVWQEGCPGDHNYGDWYTVTSATCTTAGLERRDCIDCSHYEVNVIVAHGHNYTDIITAPTCTERGFTIHFCGVCNDMYIDSYIDATGHSYGEWYSVSSTEQRRDCENCDHYETKTVSSNPFVDVSESKYYYEPVMWAVENGITSGTSATTFSPEASCTRAQVVVFLWRCAGCPEPTTTVNPFTDVTYATTSPFYKAILWAVEEGITNGATATTFNPSATVNRVQFVTFLWRYMGKPTASNTTNHFTDVTYSTSSDFYKAIMWAVESGVTAGKTATTFDPTSPCTRGQVVTFLHRALKDE